MTETGIYSNYLINEDLTEDEKDIFDNFSKYFDLNPNNIHIEIPYNFNTAIRALKNLSLEKFTNNLNEIVQREIDLESLSYKKDINFSIDNILFLTSKISSNDKFEYILLNDLKNEKYITKPNFINNKNEILDTGINLRITTKEDDKKEINIKCIVNYETFTKNIIDNLINKTRFEKSKQILEKSIKYKEKELNNKNLEFNIKIFINSINKIIYTDNGEFIFDLQFPPKFRTNFLIDMNRLPLKDKKNKNNYTYYENIMFPFRNFKDEIANLKYRHFYLLIRKDQNLDNNNENNSFNQLKNELGNILLNNNSIIDRQKFQHINNIKIVKENDIKKNYYKEGKYELSDYFRYNSDEKINQILKDLKFIKDEEENEYINNDDNENNNNEINKGKKPEDEEVIKLSYQILALVSEGILSYYNAIEFVENILFQKTKDYLKEIFSEITDMNEYPTFFNLTLTKFLEKYQNSLEEKTLPSFEYEFKTTFDGLYAEYLIKGLKEILKPSKNPILIHVQRCIITPTYILFTPYILDQGNRILRDFLPSTNLSVLCAF